MNNSYTPGADEREKLQKDQIRAELRVLEKLIDTCEPDEQKAFWNIRAFVIAAIHGASFRQNQPAAIPAGPDWRMIAEGHALNACELQAELDALKAGMAAGAPAETPKPEACGACNGTRWVPRDPDIGTEQECFSCGGSGESEADAAQAAPVQPATGADGQDAKDAARYRWLRDKGVGGDSQPGDDALLVYKGFGESSLLPDELDVAIDAAMLAPANSEKPL